MIQPGGCLQASTAGLRQPWDPPVGEIVKDWVQPTAPISQESVQPTALAHGLRTLQNLTSPRRSYGRVTVMGYPHCQDRHGVSAPHSAACV